MTQLAKNQKPSTTALLVSAMIESMPKGRTIKGTIQPDGNLRIRSNRETGK